VSLRFSRNTWAVLFERIIPDLLGRGGILWLAGVALAFSRRRGLPCVVCVCGFLFVFLLCTSVQVIHNYYAYANGVFLIAAVAWCIVGSLESGGWVRAVGLAVFVICASIAILGYYERYYGLQKKNAVELSKVSHAAERMTDPRDVILVFGQDWSSEIPFYSRRRALMWPEWMPQDMESPEMREAKSRLGEKRVGALLLCGRARNDACLLKGVRNALGPGSRPEFQDAVCAIYRVPEAGGRLGAASLVR
jgi:hypothetical protein